MYSTINEVQSAFYEAIEKHDLTSMESVWVDSDDTAYIDPAGAAVTGYVNVINTWNSAFETGPLVRFDIEQIANIESDDTVTQVVIEKVLLVESGNSTTLTSTNSYKKSPDGWGMVLHQATRQAS